MDVIARIDMMRFPNGEPGVKLAADERFMELEPIARCTYLMSVIHLCSMAISSICDDNPDDEDEIKSTLEALEIEPTPQRMN